MSERPAKLPSDAPAPRFAQVPWALQDTPGIDAACIAVYAALQRHADFGRTSGARVSDQVAAQEAGVSVRTFIRRRAKLRRLGWITWTSGKSRGGVNTYTVHRVQQAQTRGVHQGQRGCDSVTEEGVTEVQRGCDGVTDNREPVTESQVTESQVTESPDRDVLLGGFATGASRRTQAPEFKGNGGLPRRYAPAEPHSDSGKPPSPYAVLMPLVRQHLWPPDGTPPVGWTEQREGSVLKTLLARAPVDQVAVWVEGLALLRDAPGLYADPVEWLGSPGSKITSRVLLKRSGTATVMMLAHRAYWTHANRRPRGAPTTRQPVPVAPLLPKAAT